MNLEKDSGNVDPLRLMEYEFYEKLYTTQIKYYIGLHYANDKHYHEAYLILQRVSSDIEATMEFSQRSGLTS